MDLLKRICARLAPTYCGDCGWVEGCPHQS